MFNDDYYSAQTPDEHKEQIKNLCKLLEKSPLVESASINDFGRYSNFDIFVYPTIKESRTTICLQKLIRDSIKEMGINCKLMQTFPAKKTQKKVWAYGVQEQVWSKDHWAFDLNYNSYNSGTNSFSKGI